MVANEPWQKVGVRPVTPAADRLALVRAAVEGTVGLEASDLEVARGGVSYTADTVAELCEQHPGAELFLIVGADVVEALPSWERLEEVRDAVTLVVVNRPGAKVAELGPSGPAAGWRVESIEMPALEISSTDLRERAATGRPLDYLIPAPAIRAILERGLYAVGR